ncbi:hypothetical protein FH972_024152 [Carpinus fangiana]|uniref:Phosducin domain-containing protein n=1 Tax=Carpinus fangiana TaxID=176857 RepID=A0A5N6KX76_9ROSI|nr:hypothetical protein FH972_024152 [Carpinus fangiana]
MPDMPVQVPVDDPNADTEWNDILRSKGIIPEKPPSPTPQIQEALLEARRLAHENRLEGKDLDELDELEDDEDEAFLHQYRSKRMNELNTLAQTSVYNQVFPLQKPDYARDVTEASNKAYVFVLLTSSLGTNTESALTERIWHTLAAKFGDVKFCQIRADLCIEGYPERNTPTVLVYRNGDIQQQVVTLAQLGGMKTTPADFERVLVDVGAVQQSDSRLSSNQKQDEEEPESRNRLRSSRGKHTVNDDAVSTRGAAGVGLAGAQDGELVPGAIDGEVEALVVVVLVGVGAGAGLVAALDVVAGSIGSIGHGRRSVARAAAGRGRLARDELGSRRSQGERGEEEGGKELHLE